MKKKAIKKSNQKSVPTQKNTFVFKKRNYQFMFLGLALIAIGFILMTGADANTIDGVYNPDFWNPDIFSWRRIRLAPFLVILGLAIQIYAIMTKSETTS
jgi:hypothetical protein